MGRGETARYKHGKLRKNGWGGPGVKVGQETGGYAKNKKNWLEVLIEYHTRIVGKSKRKKDGTMGKNNLGKKVGGVIV